MKVNVSWLIAGVVLAGAEILLFPRLTSAQAPRGPQPDVRQQSSGRGSNVAADVARLMAYDKNGDGRLTRAELSDRRLQALFDRADANKDGVITREELTALLTKESAALGEGDFGGPDGQGGPGFDGPPPGFQADGPGGGFGGPGGRGFGGPPTPGQVLPAPLQERLGLSEEQKRQLTDLQKVVDTRLEKILTSEQRGYLEQMRRRRSFGPGGPGGPGEFGGPGRPGGPGGFDGARGAEGDGGPGRAGGRGVGRGTGAPLAANATAAEVYQQKCQGCHGAGGRGGRAPSLANLGGQSEDEVRRIVENGEGRMPGFSGSLSPVQIAAVVKYARSFGK